MIPLLFCGLIQLYQVADSVDHASDSWRIILLDNISQSAQAQRADGALLLSRLADAALDPGDPQLALSCGRRPFSRELPPAS